MNYRYQKIPDSNKDAPSRVLNPTNDNITEDTKSYVTSRYEFKQTEPSQFNNTGKLEDFDKPINLALNEDSNINHDQKSSTNRLDPIKPTKKKLNLTAT